MTAALDAAFLQARPLPRHEEGDKHARGKVLVIAGNLELPGAAVLAGLGALRAGAGVLQIATCRSHASQLGIAMPEAMVIGCEETAGGEIDPSNAVRLSELSNGCDAILIGPGMVDEAAVGELCAELLQRVDGPAFALDAAAFTSLAKGSYRPRHDRRIVVTPHSGEMAKFMQMSREAIENDRLEVARRAARRLEAVVALKGGSTYVVSSSGDALLCDHGSIGLATSGSGDTLAGILVGLLARGTDAFLATAWAVYMHGEAGRRLASRGPLGLLAREIPGEIPAIMHELMGRG
jgi:ADP-dependent NAD(P)H-hydrate dehydratase